MRALALGTAALALIATAGCQSRTAGRDTAADTPAPVALPVDAASAPASMRAGRMRAAWTFLDAGDVAAARSARDALAAADAVQPFETVERRQLDLLDAGLAFAAGDVDGAAARVDALTATSAVRHVRLATLRADLVAARGDYAGAVASLLTFAAGTSADALTLGRAIWRHGTRAQTHRLVERGRMAATVAERAWWRFLATYGDALTPARQHTLWRGWRQGRPDHPAALARPLGLDAPAPRRIALLLPLSGRLANAGARVRDGFLAAYYAAGPLPSQSVVLHDTGAATVDALYEQAMAGGADAIVGPLSKENVARMWALDPVIPTVTLNSISRPDTDGRRADPPRLVQFALAVEDEGRALARRTAADGRRRIMVFRARTDWSERALAALEGGLPDTVELVDVGVFPDIKEVTTGVGAAFAIEESQARRTALTRLFGGREVEFTPRRRADVDAVVALLDGDHADSLAAALRFHYAADVPVYASSQVLPEGARALEGMRVCDMPWRLYPSRLKGALQGPFPNVRGPAESLFAFGVDAFRIVNRLSWLASGEHRIMGGSGTLGLAGDGSIRREPAWAVVRDGNFRPLPPAAPPGG